MGTREGVDFGEILYAHLAPIWEANADSEWESDLTPQDLVDNEEYACEAAEHDEAAAYDVASMEHWFSTLSAYETGYDVPERYAILMEGDEVADGYHRMAAAWALGFDVYPVAEVI